VSNAREIFPGYREMRLKHLAEMTVEMLGVGCKNPDGATILEHSIQQACSELECLEKALEARDETTPLLSMIMGIRLRLHLAIDHRDVLADLVAIAPLQEVEAAK